jgi:pimeloyl-ACP methyl ester carboxylesterase
MKSNSILFTTALVAALTGCAGIVKGPHIYSPAETRAGGIGSSIIPKGATGEISYCEAGMAFPVKSRRDQAYAAIAAACKGEDKYTIVDSTHPEQLDGAGSLDRQSLWTRGLVGALVTGTAKEELDLLPRTGEQVLALPTFSGKPVFVLSASEPMKETSGPARFANEKRVDIARMYPGAKQVWVDSGHAIPLEKPETVVAAIREALTAVRGAKR